MRRAAFEQIDDMRDERFNNAQRMQCASWRTGKVDNQRRFASAGDGSGKNRKFRLLQSSGAHQLSETRNFAIENAACCFRSDVARSHPGSTRGQEQRCS